MKSTEDQTGDILGEGTPVKLGLIITILGLVGCLLFGAIWWASRTSTQLEHILIMMGTLQGNDTGQQKDINELQSQLKVLLASGSPQVQVLSGKLTDISDRLRLIETQGSPALIARVSALEVTVAKIREDLDIHKVMDDRRSVKP